MPHGISAVETANGLQRYVLGQRETFTLLAASFVYDPDSTRTVDVIVLDVRDPVGNIIYMQVIDYTDHISRYSLVGGSEPMYVYNVPRDGTSFPQDSSSSSALVTERLAPVTVPPRATISVYASKAHNYNPLPDPITRIDGNTIISDLFLWVEDVAGQRPQLASVGSFSLVPGLPV